MTEKEFIQKWAQKIYDENTVVFPFEKADESAYTEEIHLPQKNLMIGGSFFDNYEIITPLGETVYQAEDYDQAKFIVYASRTRPESISIPLNKEKLKDIITSYEQQIDNLFKAILKDFKRELPQGIDGTDTANSIFRLANIVRY